MHSFLLYDYFVNEEPCAQSAVYHLTARLSYTTLDSYTQFLHMEALRLPANTHIFCGDYVAQKITATAKQMHDLDDYREIRVITSQSCHNYTVIISKWHFRWIAF